MENDSEQYKTSSSSHSFWEISITTEQWNRIPADISSQLDEDEDLRSAKHELLKEMMNLVAEIMAISLTPRQQAVAHLYYLESKTQVEIAQILDISQTTVSRHIMGQKKGNKTVGGALQKIRKTIQKEAHTHRRASTRRALLLKALSIMLSGETTRREIAQLIAELIRGSGTS